MTPHPKPDFGLLTTWATLFGSLVSDTTPPGRPPIAAFGPEDPAARIWADFDDPETVETALSLTSEVGSEPAPWLPETEGLAIEVWTECELAILHAVMDWLLVLDPDAPGASRLLARLDLAVAWHLEHTQPDNATGRPWGIHAFLLRGEPSAEALDYAASMLHTVEASRMPETPLDPLVAWILDDAARVLDQGNASRLSRTLR